LLCYFATHRRAAFRRKYGDARDKTQHPFRKQHEMIMIGGGLWRVDQHHICQPSDRATSRKMPFAAIAMKTQGEIEATVCDGITRFEQEYMGRGPKKIHAHLIGDLLVVRLQGVLTAAEQHLVRTLPAERGRDLLKQVRTQLIEAARGVLEALINDVTGVKTLSLHHDISTSTGEEIVIFTLEGPPQYREIKRKSS
jgi:uncharacterized protein YbcI